MVSNERVKAKMAKPLGIGLFLVVFEIVTLFSAHAIERVLIHFNLTVQDSNE